MISHGRSLITVAIPVYIYPGKAPDLLVKTTLVVKKYVKYLNKNNYNISKNISKNK